MLFFKKLFDGFGILQLLVSGIKLTTLVGKRKISNEAENPSKIETVISDDREVAEIKC